ncbi:MAG: tetratricopeptide repeat protein, partial [Acidobacteriota bacterium]
MTKVAFPTVVFLVFMSCSHLFAQTSIGVTPDMRAEANGSYQTGDWAKAAELYDKIVKIETNNIQARYRLGVALMNSGKTADSLPHLEQVMTASPNPIFALSLARAYARSNNKAKSLEVLAKSLALGGIAPETLTAENDFAPWKDDADFKDIVRRSDLAVNPCKAKEEFRQFDFWIGDWDVKTPQGLPAGSSRVQLILGKCIIFENWSGGGGTNGKSFNIFDTNDNKWHQTWV